MKKIVREKIVQNLKELGATCIIVTIAFVFISVMIVSTSLGIIIILNSFPPHLQISSYHQINFFSLIGGILYTIFNYSFGLYLWNKYCEYREKNSQIR